MPYLSLPALAGFLRAHGHSVEQLDLNLGFQNEMIQAATFERFLAENGGPRLYAIIPEARLRAFIAELDSARAVFNSEAFYDPERLVWARSVLDKAFQLLSLFCYPSQVSRQSVFMPYDSRWPEQVLAAANDRQANPFITYYEQHFFAGRQAPDLLGISIADSTQILPGMTLAHMVRRLWPQTHVTVGGALFSKFAAGLAEHPEPAFGQFFHSAVRGEGELPLLKLVEALRDGTSLAEVPGLVWRDQNTQVLINDPGLPMAMQELVAPDFTGLPLEQYWAPELVLPLLGSKDCYWKDCVFCDHYVSYAPRYRLRKPALVADDIAALVSRHGAKRFTFGDETMSPNYARHLAQELLARELDVTWVMLSRLQKGFDPDTCQLLYRSGCRMVIFGLESANERVSMLMEKGTVNETSLEVYRELDAAGIFTYSFVFFGFPTETEAEAEATVNF
ncbi:MAG: radical SAM protein, partial [Candidatus Sericytochromatia bacterium]